MDEARGYSPRRPDAVMGTDETKVYVSEQGFKGSRSYPGHCLKGQCSSISTQPLPRMTRFRGPGIDSIHYQTARGYQATNAQYRTSL